MRSEMECKYSIIIPIYKVEKYLEKCIESTINQTFNNFEVILVDDGSPDLCPDICDKYQNKDKRIHVIHKENGGLVSARNAGLKRATGKYICYLDGDDWISEDLLEILDQDAVRPYNPDMVIFDAKKVFHDREVLIHSGGSEGYYDKDRLEKEVYPYMMYDCRKSFCHGLIFPTAWNKIYNREFLLKHYCRDERIRMGEDNAFIFECLYFADSVCFINKPLYYYNQLNETSFIHSYDADRFKNNEFLCEYIEKRIKGKSPVLDSQINAFRAYWCMMAVFQEIKCERQIAEAAKHIKNEIENMHTVDCIDIKSLPKTAKLYIFFLQKKQYLLIILLTWIVQKLRRKENGHA